MKIHALAALLAAVPAAAFTVGSLGKKNPTFSTALNNGMAAYDAQMRALAAGQPIFPVGQQPAMDSFDPSNKFSQRWRKKTKQLATLGPASDSFEMIEQLFLAGADVFRLNFSHGEHAQKKELLDIIRQVELKYDHPIAVLGK